uniref:Uncharacterized protein n=1 Tax=Anopheles farauti TaxID=69004 RepID=A0A182QRC1_9DIPT
MSGTYASIGEQEPMLVSEELLLREAAQSNAAAEVVLVLANVEQTTAAVEEIGIKGTIVGAWLGLATTTGLDFEFGAPELLVGAPEPPFGGEPTSTTVLMLAADDEDPEFCALFD